MIATNVHGTRQVGDAETELANQLAGCNLDCGINLTRIWYEAGRPVENRPEDWADGPASGFLKSFSVYAQAVFPKADLYPHDILANEETLWGNTAGMLDTWVKDDDEATGWESGDVTTLHLPVALAYALYLDTL